MEKLSPPFFFQCLGVFKDFMEDLKSIYYYLYAAEYIEKHTSDECINRKESSLWVMLANNSYAPQ